MFGCYWRMTTRPTRFPGFWIAAVAIGVPGAEDGRCTCFVQCVVIVVPEITPPTITDDVFGGPASSVRRRSAVRVSCDPQPVKIRRLRVRRSRQPVLPLRPGDWNNGPMSTSDPDVCITGCNYLGAAVVTVLTQFSHHDTGLAALLFRELLGQSLGFGKSFRRFSLLQNIHLKWNG